ncbi:NADP-dependent oxidoreductase [Streptomyces erythrogriseus]|uniref:NADP-dependent oxidoreductase n=1 Tax=Streptomyces erythrogriseus TaxID=284027 RepID=A0ABN3WFP7_9ACTN
MLQPLAVPVPHAGPGEVRLRVHAAAVSPTDILLRAGLLRHSGMQLPYCPGQDAAGVVDEVGPGVAGLAPGDRVMAMVMPTSAAGGAFREHIVLPAVRVAHSPSGTSHEEAAALPMNGLTARLGLDLMDLAAGQLLAVTGAAGAVGGYLVELAKADGLRGVADAAVLGTGALGAVRDGGQVAAFRGTEVYGALRRGLVAHAVYVPDYVGDRAELYDLRQLAERGELSLRVARILPAAEAAHAHRLMEAVGLRGRVVLTF